MADYVQAEVLRYVPARMALQLRELLGHEEDEAGGIMTTTLVQAKSGEKVKKVAKRLAEARNGTRSTSMRVAVVDDDGRLLDDVTLLDLLLALAVRLRHRACRPRCWGTRTSSRSRRTPRPATWRRLIETR